MYLPLARFRSLISFLWVVMVDIFFREIRSRGSYRIPRRGPVIFVAAPHANQVSIAHIKQKTEFSLLIR
jgi:1-acyl-sn-glycerol-3-phosphate acyltransferase